jgi:hypothetical protein
MPPGRPTRLARWIGRALSRHQLRRALAARPVAEATLATVLSTSRRTEYASARSRPDEP